MVSGSRRLTISQPVKFLVTQDQEALLLSHPPFSGFKSSPLERPRSLILLSLLPAPLLCFEQQQLTSFSDCSIFLILNSPSRRSDISDLSPSQ